LNSLIAILHELGHYLVARMVGSGALTIITQTDTFPPIVWIAGLVTFTGIIGSARVLFFLAPALTTLAPAVLAAWWGEEDILSRAGSVTKRILHRLVP